MWRQLQKSPCRSFFIVAAILILTIIFFAPILTTGFCGDDCINRSLYGGLQSEDNNLWEFIWMVNSSWMDNGRFFPLAWLTGYPIFYYLELEYARLYHTILIFINLGFWWWFVFLLSESRGFASMTTFCVLPFMQIRAEYDPIGAYVGFLPLCFLLVLLSGISFLNYTTKRNIGWIILSLASFVCGVLIYEVNIVVIFMVVCLIFCSNRQPLSWRLLFPFFVILVCYVAICLYLRFIGNSYSGIAMGDSSLFLRAFYRQVLAGIPLDYATRVTMATMGPKKLLLEAITSPTAITVFFAGLCLSWWFIRAGLKQKVETSAYRSMACVGTSLVVFPAILIGLSARYQREILPSGAHLVVYFAYFGMCLLFSAATHYSLSYWIRHRSHTFGNFLTGLMSFAIGLVLMVTYQSNTISVKSVIANYREPTAFLEHCLKSGLLRDVSDGDVLYVLNYPSLWLNRGFIRQYGHKNMNVMTADGPIPLPFTTFAPRSNARVWVLSGQFFHAPRWCGLELLGNNYNSFVESKQDVCHHQSQLFSFFTDSDKPVVHVQFHSRSSDQKVLVMELKRVTVDINLLGWAYGKKNQVLTSGACIISFDTCSLAPKFY